MIGYYSVKYTDGNKHTMNHTNDDHDHIIIIIIIIIIITTTTTTTTNRNVIMIMMMIVIIVIMIMTMIIIGARLLGAGDPSRPERRHQGAEPASKSAVIHPVSVRRFPSFRTQPLENLSHYL